MNFAKFFKQSTGEELFKESFVELSLLLRNSFEGIPHNDFFSWAPKKAIRVKKCGLKQGEIWNITLPGPPFGPSLSAWLLKHNVHAVKQRSLTIQVVFPNDVDEPTILPSMGKDNLKSIPCTLSAPPMSSFHSKGWLDFCKTYPAFSEWQKSLSEPFCTAVTSAVSLYSAKVFFKEGFYVAPSTIPGAGWGLFTLFPIPPNKILFQIQGHPLLESELNGFDFIKKQKIEAFAFSSSFFVSKDSQEEVVIIFDPTNSNQEFLLSDMPTVPNLAPWINEPPPGYISNVLLQGITYFDISESNLSRYSVHVIAAKCILPHDELFLHYGFNYHRRGYMPGLPCPDILPPLH